MNTIHAFVEFSTQRQADQYKEIDPLNQDYKVGSTLLTPLNK